MDGLLGELIAHIATLFEAYWHWLVAGAAAIVALCFLLYLLVQLWGRYRDTRGAFKITPRYYYAKKKRLLRNNVLREFLVPFRDYVDELDEGEKRPMRLPVFLHRAPMAVLATGSKHSQGGRKVFDGRAQINELSRWIHVGPLPDWVPEKGSKDIYWVELGKTGDHTDEELEAKKGIIKNALIVKSVEPYPDKNDNVVSFIVRARETEDPMVAIKAGREFFEENAARPTTKSPVPTSLPLALTVDKQPWSLPIHHTLVFGTTGSGKGSPIQGAIRQLAPYVSKGLVDLYGADPKWAELGPYTDPSLHTPMFKRISGGSDEEGLRDIAATISQVMAILSHRMKNKQTNLDASKGEIDLGRSFTASKKNPMVIFIIDEFFTLKTLFLSILKQESKKPLSDLDAILAMGRSYGVFVMLATQFATQESLGPVRDNIANKITLRHEGTDYITKMMLGEDALELGHNPKAIGPSNPANGNRTAGIGFVKGESGDVEKVRFAYLSDEDIADLALNFRYEDDDEDEAQPTSAPRPDSDGTGSQPQGLPRFSSIQQRQMEKSEW